MPSSTPTERLKAITKTFPAAENEASNQNNVPAAWRFRPNFGPSLPACHNPLNPVTFLLKSAAAYPDELALVTEGKDGRKWTFSEWATRVAHLAHGIKSLGLQLGDRVAIVSPNTSMMSDVIQACPAARMVVVPINYRLPASEIHYILRHSGSSIVFVDSQYLDLVSDYKIHEPSFRIVISHDPVWEGSSSSSSSLQSTVNNQQHIYDYESLIHYGSQVAMKAVSNVKEFGVWSSLQLDTDENLPLAISYTSGTTGRPKGVVTTLRSTYLAAISNVLETSSAIAGATTATPLEKEQPQPTSTTTSNTTKGWEGLTPRSSYLWTLPMFHCLGWTFPFACTAAGARQLTLRQVSGEGIWDGFQRGAGEGGRNVFYCAAPTVQLQIIHHPSAKTLAFPVTTLVAGAAPTAQQIEGLEEMGIRVIHVYGLTETHGPVTRTYPHPSWTNLPPKERYHLMAEQGHSYMLSDTIRVIRLPSSSSPSIPNDDGNELVDVPSDGITMGEICIRGNIVMQGYYRNDDATKEVFRGGWFHTGDLGVRFPDGRFAIRDRSKDVIISGGENISSLAVEQVLSAHPDVFEAAVIAGKDEKYGERPLAIVVLKPESMPKWTGSATNEKDFERSLKDFVKGRLAGFARPEWVVIREALPKSATGKVLKVELRKEIESKHSS